MIKAVAAYCNVVYFCSIIFDNMKTSIFNTIFIEEPEGPDRGLPDSLLFSITVKTCIEGIVTTYSRPCLFEGCGGFSTISSMPSFDIAHDTTWDDFGRAYYNSCNYQFTEFHFTLCLVDELKQQIEAWERQVEVSCTIWMPTRVERVVHDHRLADLYFAPRRWDEQFYAWIEELRAKESINKNLWMADDHHSCHLFEDKSFYLHQLAKLSLSGLCSQARVAAQPCCRSYLMASCRQSSGDDLLGH